MAELLFLGGNKMRTVQDIINSVELAELMVYFVEGKLEKWLNDKSDKNRDYIEKLADVDKEYSMNTVNKLKEIFNMDTNVIVVDSQKCFDEIGDDTNISCLLLVSGKYTLNNEQLISKKVKIVGPTRSKPIINIGMALKAKFETNVKAVNVDICYINKSAEDLVIYLKEANLSAEDKIRIIESSEVEKENQHILEIQIDCMLQLGKIEEAIEAIKKIENGGCRNLYLFDAYDRTSNDRKKLIDIYLKPAAESGNEEALRKYALYMKDGDKDDKKSAFNMLVNGAGVNPVLLNILADFYLQGIGTKSDVEAANKKYQEARQRLESNTPEMSHSVTGIGNCLMKLKKKDDAMKYYSMSTDCSKLQEVIEYYKGKKDVKQVIVHSKKCFEYGDIKALYDLSLWLFDRGDSYKKQSLDYAIEYVRAADGDIKKKKSLLEKQLLYYDKIEKHNKEKIECNRIEREASDNGIKLSKTINKVESIIKKSLSFIVKTAGGVAITAMTMDGLKKLDGKGGGKNV